MSSATREVGKALYVDLPTGLRSPHGGTRLSREKWRSEVSRRIRRTIAQEGWEVSASWLSVDIQINRTDGDPERRPEIVRHANLDLLIVGIRDAFRRSGVIIAQSEAWVTWGEEQETILLRICGVESAQGALATSGAPALNCSEESRSAMGLSLAEQA